MPTKTAYFFKCFSHQSRNELLRLLAENGAMTVESLAEATGLAPSTASRHLGLLKKEGVVDVRVESPNHYYYLKVETIIERWNEFLDFLKIERT